MTLKAKDKHRLHDDSIQYCDQIGIYPEERPRFVFYKNEMAKILHSNGVKTMSDLDHAIGESFEDLRIIYIHSLGKFENVKEMTYHYWELILVHELVHYRFANMTHDKVTGREFQDRVEDILIKRRQFEPTHIQAGCIHSADVWKCWDCLWKTMK